MATLSDIPALWLGRLLGIPIFLDLAFLFAIVTIFFAVVRRQFPSLADYGIVILLVTAGVFLSILTHELGHALVARRFGLYADEIRIGGFYGLAILSGSPARRIDSILILLAGPLANAINSILLFLALGMPALTDSLGASMFASPITAIPVLRVSLQWLAYVNVGMVIFNLNAGVSPGRRAHRSPAPRQHPRRRSRGAHRCGSRRLHRGVERVRDCQLSSAPPGRTDARARELRHLAGRTGGAGGLGSAASLSASALQQRHRSAMQRSR
jgi:hypothetical protein